LVGHSRARAAARGRHAARPAIPGRFRDTRILGVAAAGLALATLAPAGALAADPPSQTAAPGAAPAPPASPPSTKAKKAVQTPTELSEVVVNGIPYRETVLPTRLSSTSIYGLDLNVMDTPRNSTLLSTTQLETLNIQDPRAFSYLTASSYTDSAFGTPNIPRIRGQYADLFYNGMRMSFTDNGYGAPVNFDSLENISITKGPASVIDGPGPGVGGEADFITKRPSLTRFAETGSASVDSVGNHRWTLDVGGPLIENQLGLRLSYSGEDSGSYFYGHYMRKNAVYAAVRWEPNDKYRLDFNTEVNDEQYTENVGDNRVNQALINSSYYIQGAPVGELFSSFFGGPAPGQPGFVPGSTGYQIGSPGNPYSPVTPILTEVELTNEVPFNTRITIDQTPVTSSRALLYNSQLIQTYRFNSNLTLENNTFFAYQDSDNQEGYYYADTSRGSFTIENRTDLTGEFTVAGFRNQWVLGATFRFAYTNYISDFNAETVGVYDLTSNPALWVYNAAYQLAYADAYYYKSAFGRLQLGVPGRDPTGDGNTGISKLFDSAVFFQDRVEFTPQLSVLFGGRVDAVQNHTHDPLGGPICFGCFNTLPQDHTTGVYGLANVNVSAVYRPEPWMTAYATYNFTQSNDPDGGEGGINTYGIVPDSTLLRVPSHLYEGGLKFNLLNNKLFVGSAVFDQQREVATGPGGTATAEANIRGVEIESNYQPTRNLWATASYSYIVTTLNTPADFYNYPAEPGNQYPASAGYSGAFNYIDGAGLFAVYEPNQKFNDPGIPQHVFNVLGNYKFDNGVGLRLGAQVTGPIETTTSGKLDPTLSALVPQFVINNNYYYQSPIIPWQYTLNAAIFYQFKQYIITFSIYNLTDRVNWQSAPSFYGNDFLVRNDPRTFELRLQAKF